MENISNSHDMVRIYSWFRGIGELAITLSTSSFPLYIYFSFLCQPVPCHFYAVRQIVNSAARAGQLHLK